LLSATGRKVVLFSPPYQGKVFGPPLGLLSLAAAIREHGFWPVIIDGAIVPDFLNVIAHEVKDAFSFGVSLLTGPVIHAAIAASQTVRRVRPDLPIVFGGWHPTLLTAQTLEEEFVDIVVRHQGERTFSEILQRQASGATLDFVAGCWFKRAGKVVSNQDRPASPLSNLPGARV
jgi:anaerobic magnesium-protoporphyrin IX monomethyl ester cyclase